MAANVTWRAIVLARLLLVATAAQGGDAVAFESAKQEALETPRELHPVGDYAHPSGFSFPAFMGDFRRAEVVHYDTAGTNASAAYNRWRVGRAPILATLYVYPASGDQSLEQHFEGVIQEVARHHGGAQPNLKEKAILCNGRYDAIYAAFRYTEAFGGSSPQPLHSYAVLYQWGTYWVKWRVTFPAPQDLNEVLIAMSSLTQSVTPPNPQAGQISERQLAMGPRGHVSPEVGVVRAHFTRAARHGAGADRG